MRSIAVFAFATFSTIAFAQPGAIPTPVAAPVDSFQIHYAGNLNIGDSVINITNTGTLTLPTGLETTGNMCANVYTFNPAESMVSCCSCLVTPNGLNSLSVRNDLIGNLPLTSQPSAVVVKLLATTPLGLSPTGTGGVCNPTSPVATPAGPGVAGSLVPGMRAWGTTLHAVPTQQFFTGLFLATTYTATETTFQPSTLSPAELTKLTLTCNTLQAAGGAGICRSCRTGALAPQQ